MALIKYNVHTHTHWTHVELNNYGNTIILRCLAVWELCEMMDQLQLVHTLKRQ